MGLSDGFWLGKLEVTQSEWKQVVHKEPWKGQPIVKEGDAYPATHVSHDVALAFCKKLTLQERTAGRLPAGFEYTLPTEAQWGVCVPCGNGNQVFLWRRYAGIERSCVVGGHRTVGEYPG